MILIILGIIIFAGILAILLLSLGMRTNNSKNKAYQKEPMKFGIKKSTWFTWYAKLDTNFLTRKGLRNIAQRLTEMSVYSQAEIKIYATEFWIISYGTSFLIILFSIFLFRDIFLVCIVASMCVIVKMTLIDDQITKIHNQVLNQLNLAISSLRQAYLRLGSIPEAVQETQCEPLVKSAFDSIYVILTETDAEKNLNEFYTSNPFKSIRTLAGVCYEINECGDTKLPTGEWNFIQALELISEEIRLEIQKNRRIKMMFGNLRWLPLVPIVGMGILQIALINIMPGLSQYYNGAYGYGCRILILVASIIGFYYISTVNQKVASRYDDRNTFILNLMGYKWFYNFIKNLTPKKKRKTDKKNSLIKGSLSTQDLHHLYGVKLLYATITFIVSIIALILITTLGRQYTFENVKDVSFGGSNELTEEEAKQRYIMDKEYLSYDKLPDKAWTIEWIGTKYPKYTAIEREEQADRIMTKYKKYHNSYFHWYYLLVAYFITFIAWNVPELILDRRVKQLKVESEEDVLQLQTIILILSYTPADTLTTLYWLEKQSDIHKIPLLECYMEYCSDPELALVHLKNKVIIQEFQQMVSKLMLTIHQITLVEAFSDLVANRRHVMQLREMQTQETLKNRRTKSSYMSLLSLYIMLILYFIAPLCMLAFTQFTSTLEVFNN